MALQLAIQYQGFNAPTAYFEVINYQADKLAGQTIVSVRRYSDSTKQYPLDHIVRIFPYNADATVAWAYNQLKTLPEFADAIDV